MILNVSGRCDIVAFYKDWFMNRYKIGYLDVRNPFYKEKVSRIEFKNVDAIIFCTKNPAPILEDLKKIDKPIIFQVTLTPYKEDIEPNVHNKKNVVEAIKKLSQIIPKENIYLRYDPILLNKKYTIEYHIKAFNKLCTSLDGYLNHIIISFVDDYQNTRKNKDILNIIPFTKKDYEQIGKNFINIAKTHNMTIQTCCEEERLLEYGFLNQDCITKEMIYKLTGKTNYKKWKARNNQNCNCVEMVDIGYYNCCPHFCKYCYANYNEEEVINNYKQHDKNSSLLIGHLKDQDIIKIRDK